MLEWTRCVDCGVSQQISIAQGPQLCGRCFLRRKEQEALAEKRVLMLYEVDLEAQPPIACCDEHYHTNQWLTCPACRLLLQEQGHAC